MADKPKVTQILTCSRCGLEIGRLIAVEGEDLVQLGGLVVQDMNGNCANCGQPFRYSLNGRRLERLIQTVMENREHPYPRL